MLFSDPGHTMSTNDTVLILRHRRTVLEGCWSPLRACGRKTLQRSSCSSVNGNARFGIGFRML